MHPTISYLKHKNLLWQATHPESNNAQQRTGFKPLDDALHGGFPEYGVIDIRSPIGIGELRLLLPSLLTKQQQRPNELISLLRHLCRLIVKCWLNLALLWKVHCSM